MQIWNKILSKNDTRKLTLGLIFSYNLRQLVFLQKDFSEITSKVKKAMSCICFFDNRKSAAFRVQFPFYIWYVT